MTSLSDRITDAIILVGLWFVLSIAFSLAIGKAIAFANRRTPEDDRLDEELAALARISGDYPRKVRL